MGATFFHALASDPRGPAHVNGVEWAARVRAEPNGPAHITARGHSLLSASPLGLGLRDDQPCALDFLLSSLGSDLTLRLQAGVRRLGLDLQFLELRLRARLGEPLVALEVVGASGSPALAGIRGTLHVTGYLSDEAAGELRTAWQAAQLSSPVLQTLRRACPVEIELNLL